LIIPPLINRKNKPIDVFLGREKVKKRRFVCGWIFFIQLQEMVDQTSRRDDINRKKIEKGKKRAIEDGNPMKEI